MDNTFYEKASKLLKAYYIETNEIFTNYVRDKEIIEKHFDSLNIKSEDEYQGIRAYLINAGFIHNAGDKIRFDNKGIDEVLKDFPNLIPSVDAPTITVHRVYDNIDEVLNRIDEIKSWKTNIENIEREVQIIKLNLESIKSEIKEGEIVDLINELRKTSDLINALLIIYRILKHPKLTEDIKQLIAPRKKFLPPGGVKI